MMWLFFFILSMGMFALAIYINFYIGRRNFNRRNITGVQEFKSYGHMLRTRWYENILHFFIVLLTIFGLIIFLSCLVHYYHVTHPEKPAKQEIRKYHIH